MRLARAAKPAAPDLTAPRDTRVLILLLAAVGGAFVSGYLTVTHYAAAPLVCVTSGAFDCGAVTTSTFSVVPGTQLPIAMAGVAWWVVAGGLALAAQRRPEGGRLALAHAGWALAGLGVVLYLVYAELVVIGRVCEWCTVVHLLVLLTVALTLRRAAG